MLSLSVGLIIATIAGGAGAVGRHLWSKFRSNPVGISLDMAALAKKAKDAASDRRLSASELKEIADELDRLASKLK